MTQLSRRAMMSSSAILGGICASALDGGAAAAAEPPKHPNIILIITDQQHAKMMRCAGNAYLNTPAMDALAARGVRFERAYCGNPVCIPSRFSMMTGLLPSAIGMEANGKADVPDSIFAHALGNVFRKQGYLTVYGGKEHLPGNRKLGVKQYGFDYLIEDERDALARACAKFIDEEHEKPFLLVASFINPHDICYMAIDAHAKAMGKPPLYPHSVRERQCLAEALEIPDGISRDKFYKTLCPPLPGNFEIPPNEPEAARKSDWREFRQYVQDHWTEEDWRLHRWAYARLTERVDAQIATVLEAIRDSERERDTVIVFTSDHGDMDAAHRLEHKSMPYEEAMNVPLIVAGPGIGPAGRTDGSRLISTGLDLIPSLCSFAGITTPAALPGRSFKPVASPDHASAQWRDFVVAESESCRVLWGPEYKYAVYDRGNPRESLIDLRKDPGEMRNLAVESGYEKTLKAHRAMLAHWYQEYGQTLGDRFKV